MEGLHKSVQRPEAFRGTGSVVQMNINDSLPRQIRLSHLLFVLNSEIFNILLLPNQLSHWACLTVESFYLKLNYDATTTDAGHSLHLHWVGSLKHGFLEDNTCSPLSFCKKAINLRAGERAP